MEVGSSVSLASRFTPGRAPSAHRTRRPPAGMNEVHDIPIFSAFAMSYAHPRMEL